jgi:DNA polymerase-3 subunit delta
MLVEFLGNDLSKINNELEKIQLIVKPENQISAQIIEENIGISKDYNNFELINALAHKNIKKAFSIIQYFSQNAKNHPTVVTVSILFGFFSKVMKYQTLSNKSQAPKALGVHPYFIKDYEIAARNYPMRKISGIIASIREVDLKSKGVGANLSHGDILKELLIEVLK